MNSGNRNICHSDFTLMSSTHSYRIVCLGANNMQVSLLHIFLSLVFVTNTLKHSIRLSGFLKRYHLNWNPSFQLNCLREQSFTYLAFKFRKVVGNGDPIDIFFDFTIDPVFQATSMYKLAATFAGTRIDQRISLCRFITETDLTRSC